MTQIKDQLKTLAQHFEMTRQVGHSTALLHAHGFGPTRSAQERPVSVLCYDMRSARALNVPDKHAVSLNSLDRLRGRTGPLLLDNGALWDLFSRAAERIEQLEEQLAEAKAALPLHTKIDRLEQRLKERDRSIRSLQLELNRHGTP